MHLNIKLLMPEIQTEKVHSIISVFLSDLSKGKIL